MNMYSFKWRSGLHGIPAGLKFILLGALFFSLIEAKEEESRPLLRVFPIERKEECDMAIRFDICRACLKSGKQYAQKIFFYTDGPYRTHGCYTDSEGFKEFKISPG